MTLKEKKHLLNFMSLCERHLLDYRLVSEDMEFDNLKWELMTIESIEYYILNNY